jgi:chromosome segregation ATPase
MKTIEFETKAEHGFIALPADLSAYHNAKVRVTIFIEEPQPDEPQDNAERYSKYIDTHNLDLALEGLFAVASAIKQTQKEVETIQAHLQTLEKQSIEAMRQAKSGEKTIGESNAIVMDMLQEEEKIKQQAEIKTRELSELVYFKTQIQEVVARLKMQKETQQTVHQKMVDSSETINTIERMKSKITENEQLSKIYETHKTTHELDPKVEKEINEILNMEAQRRQQALEELKKKIGI